MINLLFHYQVWNRFRLCIFISILETLFYIVFVVGNEKVTLAFQTAHCIHNLSSHFGNTKDVITGKPARSPQGGSVREDPRGFWGLTVRWLLRSRWPDLEPEEIRF